VIGLTRLSGVFAHRAYDRVPVPLTAIVVHVTRPGGRANELLAAVAEHLGRETLVPDERGHVRILLEQSEGAAWQRVHDALDAAGDDWHEHVHVNPRPG
jgi:predicted Rdx family selenoprotein